MRVYPLINGSYTNYHVDINWAVEEIIVHYSPTPPGEIYITQPGGSDTLILGPLSVPQMRELVEALQEAIRDREPDELREKEYRAQLKGELWPGTVS